MNGFEESKANYSADEPINPQLLVGQWRRFGPYGPRYEVVSIDNELQATVKVHTSGEVTTYLIADILADPVD